MLKILCPTDFSENSEFSVEYAINLSNDLGAQLFFVTSFKVPQMSGRMGSFSDKISEAMHEDLHYFVEKYTHLIKTGLQPEFAVVEGNTTVSILRYARKNDIDLIIMGTKGSSSVENMVMGSITKKIFETSDIPVLAIPFSLRYHVTKNTLLLCLDEKGIHSETSVRILKAFKTLPDVVFEVYHVRTSQEEVNLGEATGQLAGLIENVVEVEHDDVVDAIKNYADNNDHVGIIAMVGHRHSFWERLFMETNTTAELFATNKPILLLPES
jgi:nucleotide-binding universal stress UspA family protein